MENPVTVTVYTKSGCVQCDMTKRYLDRQGIPYETRDVETDPMALDYVRGLGYLSAPVVVTDEGHWSGFRPDRLASVRTIPAVVGS